MAEGQVNIRVYLLYMAGKISSCTFRDTITQREIKYFINSTDKALAGKQLRYKYSTYRKSHFHIHSITPLSGQVKIVVGPGRNSSLPALLGKCLQKLMLSPVCIPIYIPIWLHLLAKVSNTYLWPIFRVDDFADHSILFDHMINVSVYHQHSIK